MGVGHHLPPEDTDALACLATPGNESDANFLVSLSSPSDSTLIAVARDTV